MNICLIASESIEHTCGHVPDVSIDGLYTLYKSYSIPIDVLETLFFVSSSVEDVVHNGKTVAWCFPPWLGDHRQAIFCCANDLNCL